MLKTIHICVLIALLITGCGKSSPSYQGLPLKVWAERLKSDDQAIRGDAVTAIGIMGVNAKSMEFRIREIAKQDPSFKVRLEAIYALDSMKVSTLEFAKFRISMTTPATADEGDTLDAEMSDELNDEMSDTSSGSSTPDDDDITYLKSLEDGTTAVDSTVMPTEPEAQQQWTEQRRNESASKVLNELSNPFVLSQLLSTGGPDERRYAIKILSQQQGGQNASVVDALESAKADSDSLVRKAAIEALKKWSRP
jgi:hypothetical protein